jgi:hypothetical protein
MLPSKAFMEIGGYKLELARRFEPTMNAAFVWKGDALLVVTHGGSEHTLELLGLLDSTPLARASVPDLASVGAWETKRAAGRKHDVRGAEEGNPSRRSRPQPQGLRPLHVLRRGETGAHLGPLGQEPHRRHARLQLSEHLGRVDGRVALRVVRVERRRRRRL